MALKATFDAGFIRKQSAAKMAEIDKKIIDSLAYVGTLAVNHAREQAPSTGFNDVTGNLRSSIGFVIYKNGERLIDSGFQVVGKGIDGPIKSYEYVENVASKYRTGYLLIVVAGMDYASRVETMGKDVITSAKHKAEKDLPQRLEALAKNLKTSVNIQYV